MPYRFSLPRYGSVGSRSDPMLTALDERIQLMVDTRLRQLSVALGQVMPVLTNQEWNALPPETQQMFEPCSDEPRRGVEHVPVEQAPPQGVFNQARSRALGDDVVNRVVLQQIRDSGGIISGSSGMPAPPPVTRPRPGETFHDIEPEDQ